MRNGRAPRAIRRLARGAAWVLLAGCGANDDTAPAEGGAPAAATSAAAEPTPGLSPAPVAYALDATPCTAPTIESEPPPALDYTVVQDQVALMTRVEALERELASATGADAPRLLLEVGRLSMVVHPSAYNDTQDFARARPDKFEYNEVAGEYNYTGRDLEDLIARFPESDLADDAGYALSQGPTFGECEGWVACYASREWSPVAAFLRAFPASPLAGHAVERAVEAFGFAGVGADLRGAREFYDPEDFARLAEDLEGVARALPPPHGGRLLERAALVWWDLGEIERARTALEDATPLAAEGARACLGERADALPTMWIELAPARVVHTGRVDLSWQDPPVPLEGIIVYRSTDVRALGEELTRLPADMRAWSDTTATPATTYAYRVVGASGDGFLGSLVASASTPEPHVVVLGASRSRGDGHLLVFGALPNGYPQVIRISPDGTLIERRNAAHMSFSSMARGFEADVSEVWVANGHRPGALRFDGSLAALPPGLTAAAGTSAAALADLTSPGTAPPLVSVDEAGGTLHVQRASGSDRAITVDCAPALGRCWLGRAGTAVLQGADGSELARVAVQGPQFGNNPRGTWIDPRDGSAWLHWQDGRLFHVSPEGTVLSETALTPPERSYSVTVAGDLAQERVIWVRRSIVQGAYELARVEVDVNPPALRVVAFDTPGLPNAVELVADGAGGVWLVGPDRAVRVGPDGSALADVLLPGASR